MADMSLSLSQISYRFVKVADTMGAEAFTFKQEEYTCNSDINGDIGIYELSANSHMLRKAGTTCALVKERANAHESVGS